MGRLSTAIKYSSRKLSPITASFDTINVHLASARAMAQQMIHSDFMHSVLSSGVANGTEKVDLIDGILLYVAFDDAVSQSDGLFCKNASSLFTKQEIQGGAVFRVQ